MLHKSSTSPTGEGGGGIGPDLFKDYQILFWGCQSLPWLTSHLRFIVVCNILGSRNIENILKGLQKKTGSSQGVRNQFRGDQQNYKKHLKEDYMGIIFDQGVRKRGPILIWGYPERYNFDLGVRKYQKVENPWPRLIWPDPAGLDPNRPDQIWSDSTWPDLTWPDVTWANQKL